MAVRAFRGLQRDRSRSAVASGRSSSRPSRRPRCSLIPRRRSRRSARWRERSTRQRAWRRRASRSTSSASEPSWIWSATPPTGREATDDPILACRLPGRAARPGRPRGVRRRRVEFDGGAPERGQHHRRGQREDGGLELTRGSRVSATAPSRRRPARPPSRRPHACDRAAHRAPDPSPADDAHLVSARPSSHQVPADRVRPRLQRHTGAVRAPAPSLGRGRLCRRRADLPADERRGSRRPE